MLSVARIVLRLLGLAGVLVAAGVGCDGRPDLIVVLADTLRADRIGAQREGRSLTPFLDELAASGARFTNARAASSWTVPSVASLFTSRFPSQHHLVGLDSRLAADELTLAEVLHGAGFGQMGFTANFRLDIEHGVGQGFDVWAPMMGDPKTRLEQVEEGMISYPRRILRRRSRGRRRPESTPPRPTVGWWRWGSTRSRQPRSRISRGSTTPKWLPSIGGCGISSVSCGRAGCSTTRWSW